MLRFIAALLVGQVQIISEPSREPTLAAPIAEQVTVAKPVISVVKVATPQRDIQAEKPLNVGKSHVSVATRAQRIDAYSPITLAPDPDYPGFESLGLKPGSKEEHATKAEYDKMVREANVLRVPKSSGDYVSPYDQSADYDNAIAAFTERHKDGVAKIYVGPKLNEQPAAVAQSAVQPTPDAAATRPPATSMDIAAAAATPWQPTKSGASPAPPLPIDRAAMTYQCINGQCVWTPTASAPTQQAQTYQSPRRFRLLPRRR